MPRKKLSRKKPLNKVLIKPEKTFGTEPARGSSIVLLKPTIDAIKLKPSSKGISIGGALDFRLQCPCCRAHLEGHVEFD